ncbi:MAG TPA: hypothetical protein VF290_26560 [Pyrinomonadaceae bacterium]
MDEVVHQGVRKAVRNQIVERTAIRENNQITLSLEETHGLPDDQKVLCVDYNYELRSLHSEFMPFEVQHCLDGPFACANLPGFEQIKIGSTDYSGNDLSENIKDGVFSVTLDLQPAYAGSIPVRTKRREVIYVPGSYNMVMNELCSGVSINLDQIPAHIVASVRGPYASKPMPLRANATFNTFQEQILFPGQGFEFRFTPEIATAATPPFGMYPRAVEGHFVEIESPTANANVHDGECIKGTAFLPPDSFLWVFVGGAATFCWGRALGRGVDVKADLTWEVRALYGRAADTGSFEIFAIVVDQRTHENLLKSYNEPGSAGESMKLPRPIDYSLLKKIGVEKPAAQLERFNEERKGPVLADRRGSVGDRRNRHAV